MQPDNLNVFDFDGTLIKVNSFKEISKKLVIEGCKVSKTAAESIEKAGGSILVK